MTELGIQLSDNDITAIKSSFGSTVDSSTGGLALMARVGLGATSFPRGSTMHPASLKCDVRPACQPHVALPRPTNARMGAPFWRAARGRQPRLYWSCTGILCYYAQT